jgi:hypothetical protein
MSWSKENRNYARISQGSTEGWENDAITRALGIAEQWGCVSDVSSKLTWKEGFPKHKPRNTMNTEGEYSANNDLTGISTMDASAHKGQERWAATCAAVGRGKNTTQINSVCRVNIALSLTMFSVPLKTWIVLAPWLHPPPSHHNPDSLIDKIGLVFVNIKKINPVRFGFENRSIFK